MRISDWSSDVCSSDLIQRLDHYFEDRCAVDDLVSSADLGMGGLQQGGRHDRNGDAITVPVYRDARPGAGVGKGIGQTREIVLGEISDTGLCPVDRKSTRLNSSH